MSSTHHIGCVTINLQWREGLFRGSGTSAQGHWCSGGEAQAIEKFVVFAKITYFKLILIKINAVETWQRN